MLNNQLEISVAVQKLLPKDTKCLSYINGNSNEINNISDIEKSIINNLKINNLKVLDVKLNLTHSCSTRTDNPRKPNLYLFNLGKFKLNRLLPLTKQNLNYYNKNQSIINNINLNYKNNLEKFH